MAADFPRPKYITGGCLCGKLKYRVDFPEDHDFKKSSDVCHCTQCRRNTGSLFFPAHRVSPRSAFRWASPAADVESSLRHYRASAGAERGFCADCGSLMYWRRADADSLSVGVGTVDPLFLTGEGHESSAGSVPEGGFAQALVGGGGGHIWCEDAIPGVTDRLGAWYGDAPKYSKGQEDDE